MRKLTASLVLVALAAMPAGAAAAPGGGGRSKPGSGSSTLTLRNVDPADTVVNHGDVVTFDVSTTATSRPYVSVMCRQDGTLVYSASAGFFADYPWSQDFVLASSQWSSGAADCEARLYSTRDGSRTTTLATLPFRVAA